VPADDQVTSLTGVSGSAQDSRIAFTTTHWSVVLEAQGESPAAQEALEKLCRVYWRPIYSFVRRQGAGPEEAQDLTQGFFALLLERRDLRTVRKEKGRLRSYLLAAVKHFLADEHRRDGDQTWQRPPAHSFGRIAHRGGERQGASRPADGGAHLRAPLGFDITGSRAEPIRGYLP